MHAIQQAIEQLCFGLSFFLLLLHFVLSVLLTPTSSSSWSCVFFTTVLKPIHTQREREIEKERFAVITTCFGRMLTMKMSIQCKQESVSHFLTLKHSIQIHIFFRFSLNFKEKDISHQLIVRIKWEQKNCLYHMRVFNMIPFFSVLDSIACCVTTFTVLKNEENEFINVEMLN